MPLKRSNTIKFQRSTTRPLLYLSEKELLVVRGGNVPMLMLQTWALRALREGYKKAGVEAPIYNSVEGLVLQLRRHLAFITNSLALPIPFPYYHTLLMLMTMAFSLYTLAFLILDSWATPVAMFLVLLITTGVKEVSVALANPFGDDDVDFPMQKYIADLRMLICELTTDHVWQPNLDVPMQKYEQPMATNLQGAIYQQAMHEQLSRQDSQCVWRQDSTRAPETDAGAPRFARSLSAIRNPQAALPPVGGHGYFVR